MQFEESNHSYLTDVSRACALAASETHGQLSGKSLIGCGAAFCAEDEGWDAAIGRNSAKHSVGCDLRFASD